MKEKIQARKDHLPDKILELINRAVEQKGWRDEESNYLFLGGEKREKKKRKKEKGNNSKTPGKSSKDVQRDKATTFQIWRPVFDTRASAVFILEKRRLWIT